MFAFLIAPMRYLRIMARDLYKTMSFLSLHLLVGFTVAYVFTGSFLLASGIALVEPLVNAVVFFFHERAWGTGQRSASAMEPRVAGIAIGSGHSRTGFC